MNIIKVRTLTCSKYALEEAFQPCEACPNYVVQQAMKGSK